MTITVDTDQFIVDSLDRILKQVHLTNFKMKVLPPSKIPASIKKLGKGIVPPDFFNGAKAKIIALKAIDISEAKDDDKIKIANFIKTTFFLTDDSAFSSNDIYQVKDAIENKKKKDNEEDSTDVKAIYYFVKMELKK